MAFLKVAFAQKFKVCYAYSMSVGRLKNKNRIFFPPE
jgi:hypothetical protein